MKERKIVDLTGDRECPRCKATKDIVADFGLRRMSYADGTKYERPQTWCRECRRGAASSGRPPAKPRAAKGPSRLEMRAEAARKLAESFEQAGEGTGQRTCNGCLQVKLLDEFVRDSKRPDGRGRKCKECKAAQSRANKAARRARA